MKRSKAMRKSAAIQLFGTQSALADALGISRAAVSAWGDYVPPLRAYEIREMVQRRTSRKK